MKGIKPPPAISVIIPMYNAENYIADCLESILNQTFENYEVILVNDCSSDAGRQIAENYLGKFGGRLKIFDMNTPSGKPGVPRNKGLMLSRGEYIFFMDSDDFLAFTTAFEEMFTLARRFNADLINYTGNYDANEDGSIVNAKYNKNYNSTNKLMIDKNLAYRVKGVLENKFWCAPWRYFMKRDLIMENELFFPHIRTAEDQIFIRGVLFNAKILLIVPSAFYIHRKSFGSITRRKKTFELKVKDSLEAAIVGLKWLEKAMSKLTFFQKNPEYAYYVLEQFMFLRASQFLKTCSKNSNYEVYKSTRNMLGEQLGEHDVLFAVFCSLLKIQQLSAERNIQEFNNFAVQAQNRIAELERQLNR